MKTDFKSISKFLSLILRHKPETIGITLDKNGWADMRELTNKMNNHYRDRVISLELLLNIVNLDNKNRYEVNNDQIRARQGHSISNVDLQLEPQIPPEVLFHGTVQRFISSIMQQGITKGTRQYVHLSKDIETAKIVGSRRGEPVILTIDSEQMHKDGVIFYLSSNGVWLTDWIAPKYIINKDYGNT